MAKFYGPIGFLTTEEGNPGVWEEKIVERYYYGDVNRNNKHTVQGDGLNDNIKFNNEISILADAFAYDNFFNIKYVTWMGAKLKVNTVTVVHPRLTLEIGEVYNGPEEDTTSGNSGDDSWE